MKIVLVDDSKLILKHAEQIIINSGIFIDIITCEDGLKLLEICENEDIDIVLLDIVMPHMNGIEILKIIKQHPKFNKIDVLMFSSLSDKETLRDCFDWGASDYITKPINELEFNARIKSAVRKKMLENESAIQLKAIQNNNSELIAVNIMLQDAQNQLIQQEKLASVGHLAAGVAHEINNPLGFVSSNFTTLKKYTGKYQAVTQLTNNLIQALHLESLSDEELIALNELKAYLKNNNFQFINGDIEEIYKDTSEGLARVGKIVKGLRNFSRIDQVNEMSDYDLNEGIENTLIISRNEIKYAAEVKLNLKELPEIMASGGQINQVILNLLLNATSAIKSKHEPELGLISICTWADKEFVNLTIEDNGMGILPENLNTVFNPFFTTKPVGEGTGLGLSISYDIITNKHHGMISVESSYGDGTIFRIRLPIGRIEE